MIAWAAMGDANASIPTPQPVFMRPMFAAHIPHATSVTFVSRRAHEAGVACALGLRTRTVPVRNTRAIGKADMIHNDAMPEITVDPETYEVRADGELLVTEPARRTTPGPPLLPVLGRMALLRWSWQVDRGCERAGLGSEREPEHSRRCRHAREIVAVSKTVVCETRGRECLHTLAGESDRLSARLAASLP